VGARPADDFQPQRAEAARPAHVEVHHAGELLPGGIARDAGRAGMLAERHGVDHADRLHAGNRPQAGQHPRVEIDRVGVVVAGKGKACQSRLVHPAMDPHLLPAAGDQEAGVAQHGAGQRDLHRDQQGGEAMAAQCG